MKASENETRKLLVGRIVRRWIYLKKMTCRPVYVFFNIVRHCLIYWPDEDLVSIVKHNQVIVPQVPPAFVTEWPSFPKEATIRV